MSTNIHMKSAADMVNYWAGKTGLKRMGRPALLQLGVTDGTTTTWANMTSFKIDSTAHTWWRSLEDGGYDMTPL